MSFRHEMWPFMLAAFLVGLLITLLIGRFTRLRWRTAIIAGTLFFAFFGGYFLWFFRNPERTPPVQQNIVVAAADGVIARIKTFSPEEFSKITMLAGLKPEDVATLTESGDIVRISIFLSLFDVHVNRTPIAGVSRFLGYVPGKHLFTFDEKSSDVNQHNSIFIQGEKTCCLVTQIVGPVCRRVVYWLDHDKPVEVALGQPFGMMKFGSRLDMYFPAKDIELLVTEGPHVTAGETVIANIVEK